MAEGAFRRAIRIANLALSAKSLRKLDDAHERLVARRALASQFADAKGVIMKVGQLFAATADKSFDPLVKGIPAIPLDVITPTLERALGQPLGNVFQSIDESTAAASLGQVHRALLLNGQVVAVKIQYPDIAAQVQAEITLFGLMPGVGPVKTWGFDLASYKNSFKQNMDKELNYLSEASTQKRFKQQVNVPGLCVPSVYSEYTRPGLLIQSWEEGTYIDEISHWPHANRKKAGEILLSTLLKSLFEAGIVHADPHIGNGYFRYNQNRQVEFVLMDFGCTIEVAETRRLALLKLILAISDGLDVSPLRYFAAMGFDADKLAKIGDALPMLCRILFKPFAEAGDFLLASWQLENNTQKLLQERRWWFRSAGPSELFLLMRAFQGVVQQLETLQVRVSWSQLLRQHVSRDILDKARALTLPKLPQEDHLVTASTGALANKLRVKVMRQGKPLVELTLPAETVFDIETLMPENVLTQLQTNPDINLSAIQHTIRESGMAPQKVFDLESGEKAYSVWLE